MRENVSEVGGGEGKDGLDGDMGRSFYDCFKDENPFTMEMIERSINERMSEQFSRKLVVDVSLARYFRIVEAAREEVSGMFTEEEVELMLKANPHESVTPELNERLANIFYSAFGEEPLPEESPHYRLCAKLSKLSKMQELAVIDVLECAWRTRLVDGYAKGLLCNVPKAV